MPMRWRITHTAWKEGVLTEGEPFAFLEDGTIMCKELIEVPVDPSKATESIGSVPSPDQLSS